MHRGVIFGFGWSLRVKADSGMHVLMMAGFVESWSRGHVFFTDVGGGICEGIRYEDWFWWGIVFF